MRWRLQPHIMEAATLRGGGCSPACLGCSPSAASRLVCRAHVSCAEQVAALHEECDKGMFSDFKEQVWP